MRAAVVATLAAAALSARGSGAEPVRGVASWYGREHAGRLMADGRPFDPQAMTCAAWRWPLGTRLLVTAGGRSVAVTVCDRGPARRLGRLVDLSRSAFARIADPEGGLVRVTVVAEERKQHE